MMAYNEGIPTPQKKVCLQSFLIQFQISIYYSCHHFEVSFGYKRHFSTRIMSFTYTELVYRILLFIELGSVLTFKSQIIGQSSFAACICGACQRRTQNPVKHLRWSESSERLRVVNYFPEKIHFRCLTGFLIHFCMIAAFHFYFVPI